MHRESTAQSGSQGLVLPQRHLRKQVGGNSPDLRNRGPLAPPTPLALQNPARAAQAEAKLEIVVMGGPTSASPPLCGPEGWRPQLGAWTAEGRVCSRRPQTQPASSQSPPWSPSHARWPSQVPWGSGQGRLRSGPDYLPRGSLQTQEQG